MKLILYLKLRKIKVSELTIYYYKFILFYIIEFLYFNSIKMIHYENILKALFLMRVKENHNGLQR